MDISRSIARSAILGAALATCTMLTHAQEGKQAGEGKGGPRGSRGGQRSERREGPPSRQNESTRREADRPQGRGEGDRPREHHENDRPQGRKEVDRPQGEHKQDAGRAAPRPSDGPAHEERGRVERGPQPGGQPGRSFGKPSGGEVRPSGNRTPEHVESSRGPGQMNLRQGGPPSQPFTTRSGNLIRRDSHGQIRQVRTASGTSIYRPPSGPRRIEVVRPGGRVIV